MGKLRWITGITRRKQASLHINNEKLRAYARVPSIEQMIEERVLRWTGHVARRSNDRLVKKIMFSWCAEGSRTSSHGSRFRDIVKRALERREVSLHGWMHVAQDRSKWRAVCKKGVPKIGQKQDDAEGSQPSGTEKGTSKSKGRGKGKGKSGKSATHTEEAPYPGAIRCTIDRCGRWCNGNSGLSQHVLLVHTRGTAREGGFPCDRCTYGAPDRTQQTRHRDNAHGPESVICPQCGVSSPNPKALIAHRFREHLRPGYYKRK